MMSALTAETGLKLYEHVNFDKEFDRLSSSSIRTNDDGETVWRNAGAVAIGTFDLGSIFDELEQLSDKSHAMLRIETDYSSPKRSIKRRKLHTIHGSDFNSVSIPEADRLHQSIIELVSGRDIYSVHTEISASRLQIRTGNSQAHVDTPHREISDPSKKKVNIISAWPDQTEFMVDGYEFTGSYNKLFNHIGTLREESGLSGKFNRFDRNEIVAFGAMSTVHAEPLHNESDVRNGMMRFVFKSMIETI